MSRPDQFMRDTATAHAPAGHSFMLGEELDDPRVHIATRRRVALCGVHTRGSRFTLIHRKELCTACVLVAKRGGKRIKVGPSSISATSREVQP